MYDPEPYSVVPKTCLVVIERGEILLKRNVDHVKSFIQPAPRESQQQREPTQQLKQRPLMEPVILTDPEPNAIPAEWPVSEPTDEPGLPQPSAKISEQAVERRRSARMIAEPRWLKDYVTLKIRQSWLIKTMLLKRLVNFDVWTLLSFSGPRDINLLRRNYSLDSSNIAL